MIGTETYTAKLSKSWHQKLDDQHEKLWVLYNTALEGRIDAYRKTGRSPNYVEQAKSLTEIRHNRCEHCGCEAGRDINAAMNILQQGFGLSFKPGRNSPVRKENENEGLTLAGSTAYNGVS